MAVVDSILDLIGDTPMVDVSQLSSNPRARILVKLEGQNPGGSVKDRAAKSMIEEAEKNGSLHPGQRILESSSGNTGIGLAMIARVKGYPFKVVLPDNVSVERRQGLGRVDDPAALGQGLEHEALSVPEQGGRCRLVHLEHEAGSAAHGACPFLGSKAILTAPRRPAAPACATASSKRPSG